MICQRLCPRLSLQGSSGEGRRNGIWALSHSASIIHEISVFQHGQQHIVPRYPHNTLQTVMKCIHIISTVCNAIYW